MSMQRTEPTEEALHALALDYVARYAATEARLMRVLQRRIARWSAELEGDPQTVAAKTAAARRVAREVVARLVASGAVSDAAFAETRARTLARAGRSRRAIAQHLAQRGVAPAIAAAASPAAEGAELAAALIHAMKRRAGPFGGAESTPDEMRRVLGSFARAGFSQELTSRVLRMSREEAEARIAAFRAAV